MIRLPSDGLPTEQLTTHQFLCPKYGWIFIVKDNRIVGIRGARAGEHQSILGILLAQQPALEEKAIASAANYAIREAKNSVERLRILDEFLCALPERFRRVFRADNIQERHTGLHHVMKEALDVAADQTARASMLRVFLQVLPADTTVCPQAIVPYRTNINGVTRWSPSTYLSSTTIGNPVSRPDTAITYTIIVTDSVGCFADTATAVIRTFPIPTVNAGVDQIVPYNSSFTLNPVYGTGISSYLWTPSINSLSCTSCPVTTGIAAVTTTYNIQVTNTNGCKANDNVSVFVACSNANLNLPSAFTPNNDGKNDRFYPLTRGYQTIDKFVIYNRWGNKVFERYNFAPNTPSLGWNGETRDKQTSDPAVYVWIIEATCDVGQKVEAKGTVMVIR
jgi:gliding motility-associated-like protein